MNDTTTQDGRTAQAMRQTVMDTPDSQLVNVAEIIREALEGDSNDAEHDALAACADLFDIDYGDPADS